MPGAPHLGDGAAEELEAALLAVGHGAGAVGGIGGLQELTAMRLQVPEGGGKAQGCQAERCQQSKLGVHAFEGDYHALGVCMGGMGEGTTRRSLM